MYTLPNLPNELTPLNLKAYFYDAFFMCGCSELDTIHATVLKLLLWHENHEGKSQWYDKQYNEIGVFYILAGLFDSLGLAEHGSSGRFAWLTQEGKRLLAALQNTTPEAIDLASGEANNGVYYNS